MDQKIQRDLDSVFQLLRHREDEASNNRKRQEDESSAFLAKFHSHVENVTRPALDEVGKYVKNHLGYDYRVHNRPEILGDGQKYQAPEVRFDFLLAGERGRADISPGISMTCDKSGQKVRLHERKIHPFGSSAGPAGEFKLEEVTAALLQEKLLGVLQALLKD